MPLGKALEEKSQREVRFGQEVTSVRWKRQEGDDVEGNCLRRGSASERRARSAMTTEQPLERRSLTKLRLMPENDVSWVMRTAWQGKLTGASAGDDGGLALNCNGHRGVTVTRRRY